jgi:hypothetical protein
MKPDYCYFCRKPAQVLDGRNSYVVDCEHCGVSYEMDCTAWATKAKHAGRLLSWIKDQIKRGQQRPFIAKEQVAA